MSSHDTTSSLAKAIVSGSTETENIDNGDIVSASKRVKENDIYITLTYAQSLDGCIAYRQGEQFALSSKGSLLFTHQLRANHDAILVGVGTILADNPSLNSRYAIPEGVSAEEKAKVKNPQTIVMDTHLRIPLDCKLLKSDASVRPWVFVHEKYKNEVSNASEGDANAAQMKQKIEVIEKNGGKVLFCKAEEEDNNNGKGKGSIDMNAMFDLLIENGIKSLMIEGGATVITKIYKTPSLLRRMDKIIITISPMLLGGYKSVIEQIPKNMASTRLVLDTTRVVEGDIIAAYDVPKL